MISLICFLLTIIGCINWLCIGLLQYDFVAGLFGSQANVFSRIVYAIIGLSALVLVYAAIKNKGCIKCNGKKSSDQELKIGGKKKSKYENQSIQSQVYDNNNQQFDNKYQQDVQNSQYTNPVTPQQLAPIQRQDISQQDNIQRQDFNQPPNNQ